MASFFYYLMSCRLYQSEMLYYIELEEIKENGKGVKDKITNRYGNFWNKTGAVVMYATVSVLLFLCVFVNLVSYRDADDGERVLMILFSINVMLSTLYMFNYVKNFLLMFSRRYSMFFIIIASLAAFFGYTTYELWGVFFGVAHIILGLLLYIITKAEQMYERATDVIRKDGVIFTLIGVLVCILGVVLFVFTRAVEAGIPIVSPLGESFYLTQWHLEPFFSIINISLLLMYFMLVVLAHMHHITLVYSKKTIGMANSISEIRTKT